MTQLVISVRSSAEAVLAAVHGADLVDLKEPRRGAMGRADHATIARVKTAVPAARLSVAMGELSEVAGCQMDGRVLEGYEFAKAAPAGCSSISDWCRHWERWREFLPAAVQPVVVAYADAQQAQAPSVDELMPAALRTDAAGVLLDTFQKRGGNVFTHVPLEAISAWARRARANGKWFALAGSLRTVDIVAAQLCSPDYLAFRTAACVGGREGALSAQQVERLRRTLDKLRVA